MIIWMKKAEPHTEFTLDNLYCLELNKALIAEDKVIKSYCSVSEWHFVKIVCDYLYSLQKERNTIAIFIQELARLVGGGNGPSKQFMKAVKRSLDIAKEMKVCPNYKKKKWELLPKGSEDKEAMSYSVALYGFSISYPEDVGISEGD